MADNKINPVCRIKIAEISGDRIQNDVKTAIALLF
jgi:hypothetical protein